MYVKFIFFRMSRKIIDIFKISADFVLNLLQWMFVLSVIKYYILFIKIPLQKHLCNRYLSASCVQLPEIYGKHLVIKLNFPV